MEKTMIFNHFMGNVKAGHLKAIRSDILYQCGISTTAYGKWMKGTATPRKSNQQTINRIAQRYGYGVVFNL